MRLVKILVAIFTISTSGCGFLFSHRCGENPGRWQSLMEGMNGRSDASDSESAGSSHSSEHSRLDDGEYGR